MNTFVLHYLCAVDRSRFAAQNKLVFCQDRIIALGETPALSPEQTAEVPSIASTEQTFVSEGHSVHPGATGDSDIKSLATRQDRALKED